MKKLLLIIMLMAPLATFAQKFGIVNTQTIMQTLPDAARATGELQALQRQKEQELNDLGTEYQRQTDEYEKAKPTMNATAQQQKEEELQGMAQRLQQAYQDAQQAMQQKQDELMQPIRTKIRTAISNVGKAGGYTMIFEDGIAVFTSTEVEDVTAKVQTELSKMK